jgi:cytochrome oxidase assembly protein ShyY1
VLRFALQPRWIALLLLALVLASVCAWLGSWQLDRSRRDERPTAQPRVVELTDVARPQQTLEGAVLMDKVRVRGTFRADEQMQVVGRDLDGRPGYWVLTPLTVDDGTHAAAATLPVVRGWVPQGDKAPEPPSGTVELVGLMQGSELPPDPDPALAADQVTAVSAADLVNRWGSPIYAGYLVVTDDVGAPLHAVPVSDPRQGGFHLLNFSYALQWWVFAGFAVFLWWRLLRDSYREQLAEAAGDRPGDDMDNVNEGATSAEAAEPTGPTESADRGVRQ